jgi:transposase
VQHLLYQLQRMQFGRRSKKLDPDQLHLAFEDIEQAVAASEAENDKRAPIKSSRTRREASRQPQRARAHLPREHVTIEPKDSICPYCRHCARKPRAVRSVTFALLTLLDVGDEARAA